MHKYIISFLKLYIEANWNDDKTFQTPRGIGVASIIK